MRNNGKKALTREAGIHSDIEYVAELEKEMLEKINNLGIGPGGLGGSTTAPRSKHKHISNPHCRIAGCGKYLLSRKPPCSEGIVKNYCIEEKKMAILIVTATMKCEP